MSIFVCGDIHGTLDIEKLNQFRERDDLTKDDYLIICGDTGICGFSKKQEAETRAYLSALPLTVLFVDGNHEAFNELNDYPVDEWMGGKVHFITDEIIHLMRGQVFEIEGKKFFTFGGAYSNDRRYREEGVSWFEEELPSEEEMEEAWDNLQKHSYKVDYILTHTAPYEVVIELGRDSHEEAIPQQRFFQDIADKVDFEDWYFGHFHEDTDIENFHCRLDDVTQIL